jgi:hypothetical protein
MRYRFRLSKSVTTLTLSSLLIVGCGSTPSGPELITVEFEATGVVLRQGEPMAAARVVLTRCENMGIDGCEEDVTLAAAMTNRAGEYALDYLCVCEPGQPMPEHSLLVEMPATVTWSTRAGARRLQASVGGGDPDGSGGESAGKSRKGKWKIEPECVDHLVVDHDFNL